MVVTAGLATHIFNDAGAALAGFSCIQTMCGECSKKGNFGPIEYCSHLVQGKEASKDENGLVKLFVHFSLYWPRQEVKGCFFDMIKDRNGLRFSWVHFQQAHQQAQLQQLIA